MQAFVNERLVPVWVNIRDQPYPQALPTTWWDLFLFCDSDGNVDLLVGAGDHDARAVEAG